MRLSDIIGYYKKVAPEIVRISANREAVARFGIEEGYSNRPEILQFPSDIIGHVRRGATSFHISEERWSDPLRLTTESTKQDFDNLRIGWDLVFDIDCPWGFDISTQVAKLVIKALQYHEIKNISIKFSGNKGWHILVPFEAMPKIINKTDIAKYYPDIPQLCAQYILEFIKPNLEREILDLASHDLKKLTEIFGTTKEKIFDEKLQSFHPNIFSQIDVGLMSSRHLFRAPYSLHMKSGLVSLPIEPKQIGEFSKDWAKPESVEVKEIFLNTEKVITNEAEQLIVQAIDWQKRTDDVAEKKYSGQKFEFSDKVPEEAFPPCMKLALAGLEDGRKRSLFALLNFMKSAKWPWEELEARIWEWNKKNSPPLKTGYIKAQLAWHSRQSLKVPPPNCRQYFIELGICKPDTICDRIKNPISYPRFKLGKPGAK
ncbi:MAG: hypothetical protein HY438_01930 [DPANN group archaeon]|nr:hypothetical protein [DPANN group archaeon]